MAAQKSSLIGFLPGNEVYPISSSKAMHQFMQFTCPLVVLTPNAVHLFAPHRVRS
jgi:hypothetical protein